MGVCQFPLAPHAPQLSRPKANDAKFASKLQALQAAGPPVYSGGPPTGNGQQGQGQGHVGSYVKSALNFTSLLAEPHV
jgi:hypothetical protein